MAVAKVRRTPGVALQQTGLVAIVRGGSAERVEAVCDTLLEAGVRVIEVTAETSGAFAVVAKLAGQAHPGVEVGVGTVRNPEQVEAAAAAGATFVVSPTTDAAVGDRAGQLGLAWYPGALTPTEITVAWELGASAVKVFPVAAVGGPGYLQQVRAPLGDIPLLPTGGVEVEEVAAYLRAGALAVGLGGSLIGRALVDSGELGGLASRARAALAAAADIKASA